MVIFENSNIDIDKAILKNINIDVDMKSLRNIDIDMVIFENSDIGIDRRGAYLKQHAFICSPDYFLIQI